MPQGSGGREGIANFICVYVYVHIFIPNKIEGVQYNVMFFVGDNEYGNMPGYDSSHACFENLYSTPQRCTTYINKKLYTKYK